MDDLSGKLNELLSSPEKMEQIRGLAGRLGLDSPTTEKASAPPPPAENNDSMMKTMMAMAPLLQTFNQEDDTLRFLHAMRPLLGEERQTKLDEAVKILRLMRMLPLLKETGILSSLTSIF